MADLLPPASTTRRGIDTSKFMGASFAAGGGLKKQVELNSKKITLLKNIVKAHQSTLGENLKSLDPANSPLNESIQSITDSVTSIQQVLLDQQELDKDQEDDDAKADQQKKRNLKEKLVEGGKGLGKNVMAGAKKALEPVKGAFQKILDWVKKLIMAKVVIELVNWFTDKNNQKKVSTIFRFIKDWWPAILTGLLLFAGSMLGPGGMILAAGALVVGFIPKLVDSVKSLLGFGRETTKDALQGEKDAKKLDAEAAKEMGGDQDVTQTDIGKTPEPGQQDTPGTIPMAEGGQVPGSGDKDTVPAMLTPGEFVMSKDAVQQYGADTLANMNAAVGGKNNGSPLRGFSEGGMVPGLPNQKMMEYNAEEIKTKGGETAKADDGKPKGVKRALTGYADFITGGLFDFDGKSGGGLLSKGKNFLGGLFGGKKKEESSASDAGGGKGKDAITGFVATLKSIPLVGKTIAKAGNALVTGVDEMIQEKHKTLHLSTQQSKSSAPGPLDRPPLTVAYADAQEQARNNVNASGGNPGGKIPNFSAAAKVDSRKIKVLGITR